MSSGDISDAEVSATAHNRKQLAFHATLLTQCPESALEQAISMPGWSHADGDGWARVRVSWYPFENYARRIYFHAAHRTDAERQCQRAMLHIRDLAGA